MGASFVCLGVTPEGPQGLEDHRGLRNSNCVLFESTSAKTGALSFFRPFPLCSSHKIESVIYCFYLPVDKHVYNLSFQLCKTHCFLQFSYLQKMLGSTSVPKSALCDVLLIPSYSDWMRGLSNSCSDWMKWLSVRERETSSLFISEEKEGGQRATCLLRKLYLSKMALEWSGLSYHGSSEEVRVQVMKNVSSCIRRSRDNHIHQLECIPLWPVFMSEPPLGILINKFQF